MFSFALVSFLNMHLIHFTIFENVLLLIKEGNKAATLTIGFGQRNVKNTSLIDNAGAAPVCLISETVSIDLDFIYMVFTRLEVLC